MNVETLAALAGVEPGSVLDHKQIKGAYVLRIDLSKEPQLQKCIEAGSTGKRQLPDGDKFETDFTLDGTSRPFAVEVMEKKRSYSYYGPDDKPIPAWVLSAQIAKPNSLFGATLERLSFVVFDKHSGQVYDLSEPNPTWHRPWMHYGLGYPHPSGWLNFVLTNPVSGTLEVHHELVEENSMELAGAFAGVRFNMPNAHEEFEQLPDREFVVELPSGFYALNGQWTTLARK